MARGKKRRANSDRAERLMAADDGSGCSARDRELYVPQVAARSTKPLAKASHLVPSSSPDPPPRSSVERSQDSINSFKWRYLQKDA